MKCSDCGESFVRYAAKNKLTSTRCDQCKQRHNHRQQYQKRKALCQSLK